MRTWTYLYWYWREREMRMRWVIIIRLQCLISTNYSLSYLSIRCWHVLVLFAATRTEVYIYSHFLPIMESSIIILILIPCPDSVITSIILQSTRRRVGIREKKKMEIQRLHSLPCFPFFSSDSGIWAKGSKLTHFSILNTRRLQIHPYTLSNPHVSRQKKQVILKIQNTLRFRANFEKTANHATGISQWRNGLWAKSNGP